jgi:hypothetical protein
MENSKLQQTKCYAVFLGTKWQKLRIGRSNALVTQSNKTALHSGLRDLLLSFLQWMDKRFPQPVLENLYSQFTLLRHRSVSVTFHISHSISLNFLARMLVFSIL